MKFRSFILRAMAATAVLAVAGPAAFAAEKPQYGGHLRIAYNLEPTSLDPMVGRSGGDIFYTRQMFDQLIAADQSGLPDKSASLVTAWEISDNPHSMTWTLREGVKFHDGTPFNAEAVKFHFDRLLDPATKATSRALMASIDSVEVLGEYKIKLNLKAAWAPAFGVLADRGGQVNSPTAIQKLMEEYGWNPSGTGPFKLKEVVTGSYVHMVRNEDYWGKDADGNRLPYLDEVTIKVIKDDKVLVSAMKSGEIDVAYLPARDVDAFEADPNFHTTKMEGASIGPLLVFNPDVEPMTNVDLRRAIAQAVSPDAINKAVYSGKNTPADSGLFPPGIWAYDKTDARLRFDPAKAKEALAKGGKPDGFEIDILTWNQPALQQAAEIVRAQLGQIGVKANIVVETVGSSTEKFFVQKQSPLFLTTWSRQIEPDSVATLTLRHGAYYNPVVNPTPEVDALVAKGVATYDQAERKKIYGELNDYVLSNALWHPLIYVTTYAAAPNKVQNLETFIGADGKMVARELWIKQ